MIDFDLNGVAIDETTVRRLRAKAKPPQARPRGRGLARR
jgi:hypothetical protein